MPVDCCTPATFHYINARAASPIIHEMHAALSAVSGVSTARMIPAVTPVTASVTMATPWHGELPPHVKLVFVKHRCCHSSPDPGSPCNSRMGSSRYTSVAIPREDDRRCCGCNALCGHWPFRNTTPT